MRVVMLTNAVAPDKLGGLERYVRELSAALVRLGVEVTVLAKRMSPDHPPEEIGSDGVVIARHEVPDKRRKTFALRYPPSVAAGTLRRLRGLEDAVVHGHYPITTLPVALSGRPYVYTFHAPVHREVLTERQGTYVLPRAVQRPAIAGVRRAEATVVRRARRVFVLSEFTRAELAWLSPPAARAAHLVPGGLDTARFAPAPDPLAADARTADPLLFTARRLTPRTGVMELVEAMPAIVRDLPRAQLAIAGAGALADRVARRIAELALEGHVRLLGRVSEEDLVAWYRAATIVVMPTRELEGFGLTTAEALACGTPVVATPVGANPELLERLHPRLLSADASSDRISEAVVTVASDPRLLRAAAAGARDRVHPEMSWEAVAVRYLESFRELLPPSPRRIRRVDHASHRPRAAARRESVVLETTADA